MLPQLALVLVFIPEIETFVKIGSLRLPQATGNPVSKKKSHCIYLDCLPTVEVCH